MRVFKCPEGLETLGKHDVCNVQSWTWRKTFWKSLDARCFFGFYIWDQTLDVK